MAFGFSKDIAKIAAPIVGGALGGPVGLAIGGAVSGAIGGAENQGKANELTQAAIDRQRQEFAARQPFRDLLQQRIGNQPQRQDLSALFQTENPFSRPVQQ